MALTDPRFHPEPKPTRNKIRNITQRFSSITCKYYLPVFLLLTAFVNPSTAGPPQPAMPPLLSGQPFIIFWGIPDSFCSTRPDPRSYGMERKGRVAVFYEDTLGNYPYFIDKDTAVNGGLPQHTKLESHIQKTLQDIGEALPAPRYLGLGVLRWEAWAPQWARNKEKQEVYREASRTLLKSFFPSWTPEEVEKWSKVDFEAAAQSVLTETLQEIRRLRPKALWGVSPYPSCYNGGPNQTMLDGYTGQCPSADAAMNDELLWLWKRSSAIYPLLTLEKLQADLVNTIGESAAMGTAGVVIWERSETKTERECQDLAEFIRNVLGPYSVNVTTAARLCSSSLCQGRGRCVRQNPESSAYLHLPPAADVPEKATEKAVSEKATNPPDVETKAVEPDPAELWKKDFQCQWYQSSDEDISDQQSPKDGASIGGPFNRNAGGVSRATTASSIASISKGASESKGSPSALPGSPMPSVGGATDCSTTFLSSTRLTVLLSLLAACLEP
ncbi:glyco_hydro_56 domain-containing protein isoform X2 [Synchiropus splendidus]|uniref:glyco_hydro_56 domain-containing protein isoform X2 n=1 Tax=Synchiropus splendidus TaxID=270530 RepID=UPI00237EE2D1|nr:glyco_hydro_56 domain-containing protein isoform X2 [Synchiropus splendidus]